MIFGANSKRVFVAKNCTRTSGITAANLADKLGVGEVYFTDENGALIDTATKAAATKTLVLHQGVNDGRAVRSDVLRKGQIKRVQTSKFVQQIERKVYIGWNGTAGAIELIDGNDYMLTIEHRSTSPIQQANPFICGANVTSKLSGGTQYDVAKAMVDQLVLTYSQFDPAMRINVVGDTTSSGGVTGASVVRGNATVSYTGGTPPVVGDKLVVPGYVDVIYGTELDSIYQVTAVDSTNKVITLDREYQNVSQDALAITIVSAGTNYGIELRAIKQDFRIGFGDLLMIDWFTTLKNFGVTPLTITPGVHPTGRHEQVGTDELFFQGYAGRNQDQRWDFQTPYVTWIKDHAYSAITIEFDSNQRVNTLETNGQPKSMVIYLDRSTYSDVANDAAGSEFGTNIKTGTGLSGVSTSVGSLLNILNTFMVAAGVLSTGANTVANGGNCVTAGTTFSTGIDV